MAMSQTEDHYQVDVHRFHRAWLGTSRRSRSKIDTEAYLGAVTGKPRSVAALVSSAS
jgi:hypothetical protein